MNNHSTKINIQVHSVFATPYWVIWYPSDRGPCISIYHKGWPFFKPTVCWYNLRLDPADIYQLNILRFIVQSKSEWSLVCDQFMKVAQFAIWWIALSNQAPGWYFLKLINGFIQIHWMAILQTRELKNWKTQVTKVIS